MIRHAEECKVEYREHMRDGDGTVIITNFIEGPGELNEKGRLFAKITLNTGCSIGYHVHDKDAELFYIMKGTAEYNDNGEIKISGLEPSGNVGNWESGIMADTTPLLPCRPDSLSATCNCDLALTMT